MENTGGYEPSERGSNPRSPAKMNKKRKNPDVLKLWDMMNVVAEESIPQGSVVMMSDKHLGIFDGDKVSVINCPISTDGVNIKELESIECITQEEAFMQDCWKLSHDKKKCELCEFRFKCYTQR